MIQCEHNFCKHCHTIMMRCVLFIWIVLRTVTGKDASIDTLCSVSCSCDNESMECATVPKNIPSNIRSVFIKQTPSYMYRSMFDDTGQNVQKMEIKSQKLYLENRVMASFYNLTHLKMYVDNEFHLEPYAFEGLESLVELDLSGNGRLKIDNLMMALNPQDKQVLQNLKTLNMRGIQSAHLISITINATFYEAVTAGRNLKQIDISETNIGLADFSKMGRFCETVETLIVHNSTIATAINFIRPSCGSLKTLDLSGIYFPVLRFLLNFETARFSCLAIRMFLSIENIILDNMVDPDMSPVMHIANNYHLNMAECSWNLTHISFRSNNLRLLNMTVTLSLTMKEAISFIDISNNILEYIKPSVISSSINTNHLDLSHNRLHMMQKTHYHEFNILFQTLVNLKNLILSHNDLTDLQADIFQQTRNLQRLNLAYNKITSITFSFEHLVNLRFLTLKSNNIHFLDVDCFTKLDTFPGGQNLQRVNNSNFVFDISENGFICECDNTYVDFIKWIQTTGVINRTKSDYTCTMNDQKLNIDSTTVRTLHNYCLMITVKLVLIIAIPITVLIILVSVTTKIFLKKRYARQQTFKDTLSQIQCGTFPWRYLAFVSFCSENEETVNEHILPQLNQTIKEITETSRDLVSIGDTHIRPGFPIRDELVECILNSAVTIIIESNVYCEKQCCQIEADESYNLNKPIILIMLEKVEPDKMGKTLMKIFRQYTHASWISDENGGHFQPNVTQIVNSMITLAGNNKKFFNEARTTDIDLELQ